MIGRTVSRWIGARVPQTVRFRLSVVYAGLFLGAGAVLLALTYGLLANSLPSASTFTVGQQAKATLACKVAKETATAAGKPSGVKPVPVEGAAACAAAYRAGASQAVNTQRAQTLHNLLLFSLLGLAVMTVASGGLGWIVAGRVLRPVSAITGAARRASERHLGERVALQGPNDELKVLADTFDEMLGRLDAAFASQKRFVADASHELRTPLTVMRTALDVTMAKAEPSPEQLEAMTARVRRALSQAESLIDSLLTLAVSERRSEGAELVDLAAVAEDILDGTRSGLASAGLRAHADLDPAETEGDPVLLARLVGNLIDNAVRYNIEDGWISIRTGHSTDGRAFVEVANSGPTVAEDVVPKLFEPFYRTGGRANSGEGAGLGLAIVQSIASAHSADLDAHARAEGGLRIRIAMPIAESP